MSQTTSSARIQDIVRQIRGAAMPFLAANIDAIDAREVSKLAGNQLVSAREGIMVALADLSMKGQWTAGEVKTASHTAAGLSNNETEKALSTFISETRKAMSPKVRMHVDVLISVRDKAWEAEKLAYAEDKDTPTPLRKAFSRGYHCLMQMMGEAEEGRVIDNVPALMGFAAERDPDLDIAKVQKRLASISTMLAGFHRDWPVADIQLCVDTLNEVTEKALRASRAVTSTTVVEKVEAPATVVVIETAAFPSPEDNEIDQLMAIQ
jgi:hypothetical protein